MHLLVPISPAAAPRTMNCVRGGQLRVVAMAKKGAGDKGTKGKKEAIVKEPPPRPLPYLSAPTIFHTMNLLDSYKRMTTRTLMTGIALQDGPKALYEAPFVIVSHGTEDDPVFNYGNAAALNLWEMDFDTFTSTPSRQSAQADDAIQAERQQQLASIKDKGFTDGYHGVRVSAKGRRFRRVACSIENVTLWTVATGKASGMEGEQGKVLGQAATFSEFTWLDDGDAPEKGKAGEKWRIGPGGVLMPATEAAPAVDGGAAPAPAGGAAPAAPAAAKAAPAEGDLVAARAAVDEQGAVVRDLKKARKAVKDNADPDVQAAVKVLLERKAALAALEEAAKTA